MTYWPDTKIVKSYGNAFNWRENPSLLPPSKHTKSAATGANGGSLTSSKKYFVYSRAQAAK